MAGQTLLHERDLIRWLRRLHGARSGSVIVGLGDDAAVVRPEAGSSLILTTDCLVEGVHFRRPDVSPRMAGRKAVMRAVSDVAAMGGAPRWVLSALCLPVGVDGKSVKAFCRGMESACEALGVDLVGGDITRTPGPFTAVVTVIGEAGPGGVVRRSAAQPGDAVCVTGRLGGSILGRHVRFTPRVREAQELVRRFRPHAMIDLSDGLSIDARHVAEESGAGIVLDAARVPVSPAARRLSRTDGRSPLWHALNDGEDYELLWAAAPPDAEAACATGLCGVQATLIGRVTARQGLFLRRPDGRIDPIPPEGWEHTF